jgi:hypothetical protein
VIFLRDGRVVDESVYVSPVDALAGGGGR